MSRDRRKRLALKVAGGVFAAGFVIAAVAMVALTLPTTAPAARGDGIAARNRYGSGEAARRSPGHPVRGLCVWSQRARPRHRGVLRDICDRVYLPAVRRPAVRRRNTAALELAAASRHRRTRQRRRRVPADAVLGDDQRAHHHRCRLCAGAVQRHERRQRPEPGARERSGDCLQLGGFVRWQGRGRRHQRQQWWGNDTLATLDTLANLVSLCAAAANSSSCSELLRLATPSGASAPADTLEAIVNLARNPTLAPAALYRQQSGRQPTPVSDETRRTPPEPLSSR
jgi:hypothetical protein